MDAIVAGVALAAIACPPLAVHASAVFRARIFALYSPYVKCKFCYSPLAGSPAFPLRRVTIRGRRAIEQLQVK
jgi:hypothetical protein